MPLMHLLDMENKDNNTGEQGGRGYQDTRRELAHRGATPRRIRFVPTAPRLPGGG